MEFLSKCTYRNYSYRKFLSFLHWIFLCKCTQFHAKKSHNHSMEQVLILSVHNQFCIELTQANKTKCSVLMCDIWVNKNFQDSMIVQCLFLVFIILYWRIKAFYYFANGINSTHGKICCATQFVNEKPKINYIIFWSYIFFLLILSFYIMDQRSHLLQGAFVLFVVMPVSIWESMWVKEN